MRTEIVMPKMGESVTEGTIIKWHKKPGDFVKRDEIIFEISTDKVDTEIPSQNEGYITEILFGEGETLDVGKVVAILDSEPGAPLTSETTENKKNLVDLVPELVSQQKETVPVKEIKQNPTDISAGTLIDIPMPKMGESVMEGTIIKWHKKIGDPIKKDEIIFEISTDKVDTEVPSPSEGFLVEILVTEQTTVPVGTIVARLGNSDVKVQPASSMHDVISQVVQTSRDLPEIATPVQKADHTPLPDSSRFYSPLVMNIAKVEKISMGELENIIGSGQGGRVSKNDVLNYLKNRTAPGTAQAAPPQNLREVSISKERSQPTLTARVNFESSLPTGSFETMPMDNIRQKIMQHMIHSRDTSVHVTGLVEVDMTRVANYLSYQKESVQKNHGIKLTYMSFIAHAVVKAIQQHPLINASIDNNNIIKKRDINLGIAVALEPNGLIVPNMKNSGEKNLLGIAKGIAELAEKARTKRLTPDDISGGTFTITNYGVFGTLFGTPIINQPEVAILGVGAVVKRAVVVENEGSDMIAIRSMMYLTLSHDHRLVDGMLGGKFLKDIKFSLENFNGNLTD